MQPADMLTVGSAVHIHRVIYDLLGWSDGVLDLAECGTGDDPVIYIHLASDIRIRPTSTGWLVGMSGRPTMLADEQVDAFRLMFARDYEFAREELGV